MVKFFPHEAADFEPVLALLHASRASRGAQGEDEEGTGAWEVPISVAPSAQRALRTDTHHRAPSLCCQTRAVLLLWLSILVLIPFDLATVDSSLAGAALAADEVPPVVLNVVSLCQEYLAEPGIVRDMAAATLARLLTRPDMGACRDGFLAWCGCALAREGAAGRFLVPGAAAALAGCLKHGSRAALAPRAAALWAQTSALAGSAGAARSPLLRKLAVKLAARVGLLLLPPRLVTWRYQRGARSLHATLGGDGAPIAAAAAASAEALDAAAADDDDCDVPEEMEGIFELLLSSLRDSDTVVRWAAAKGLGRLTSRLPLALADEVLQSVLQLFQAALGDGAWHGGCLALAELARRGTLLPARLPQAVPLIAAALRFDVRRGPHSVGTHVRDAGCYVVWAAARAYAPAVLAPHARHLAPTLLALACYDREVNCRRAAAAAFQECVGRLGGGCLEHGIDVVQRADYFSLGARAGAYLTVGPAVAAFQPYRRCLAETLLTSKTCHWDKALRLQAACALAALAPLEPEWMAGVAVEELLPRTLHADPGVRHGALVALAAVLEPLHRARALSEADQAALAGCVPALEKARLYRGRGGELVRASAQAVVAAVAQAGLPASPRLRAQLAASADESLRHPNAEVQAAAAAAAGQLVRAHGGAQSRPQAALRYASMLAQDDNPAARRGAALALAALPKEALAPSWRPVAAAAAAAAAPERDPAQRDAETRVNAVRAMGALVRACGVAQHSTADEPDAVISLSPSPNLDDDALLHGIPATAVECHILPALLAAMDDYCTDNRGDVGSWVREAAMAELPHTLCALLGASAPGRPAPGGLCASCVCALLKQAAEKIDRVRVAAASALAELLGGLPAWACAGLAHAEQLRVAFAGGVGGASFGVPGEAYPVLATLLPLPPYRPALVQGLLVSVGGIGDSLSKAASGALLAAVAAAPQTTTAHQPTPLALAVTHDILAAMAATARQDRVTTPAMRTLEALYAHAGMATAPQHTHAVLLAALQRELHGCRDIPKLCAAATLLAQMMGVAAYAGDDAGFTGSSAKPLLLVRHEALRALCGLMAGPYPRVRRCAAEAAYLRLLDSADCGECAAAERLAGARWDGTPQETRASVCSLYAELGLGEPPASLGAQAALAAAGHAKKGLHPPPEHDSYASLVESAGY